MASRAKFKYFLFYLEFCQTSHTLETDYHNHSVDNSRPKFCIFLIKLEKSEILIGPFILAGLVASVILAILVYRIRTFNDCPEAAAELRKQIEQAREDLSAKGFKFD